MNLEASIIALGKTPDEVYFNLKSKNFKGRPKKDCDCPIARYLSSFHGRVVSVGTDTAMFLPNGPPDLTDLTRAVKKFIKLFDSGEDYQDLKEV